MEAFIDDQIKGMSKIVKHLESFFDDLGTVEVAILGPTSETEEELIVKTYSRVDLDGDALNYLDAKESPSEQLMMELHTSLMSTSVKARMLIRDLIITALR